MLLERPGEIVTRDEVRQCLWPENTFVEFDNSLGVAIRKVRDALNDDAEAPRYVETIPRRGYRFVAPVTVLEPVRSPDPLPPTVLVTKESSVPSPIDRSRALPPQEKILANGGLGCACRGRRDLRIPDATTSPRQSGSRRRCDSATNSSLRGSPWLPEPAGPPGRQLVVSSLCRNAEHRTSRQWCASNGAGRGHYPSQTRAAPSRRRQPRQGIRPDHT